MPECLLGIDIGANTIKAAIVKRRGYKYQVVGADTMSTPEGGFIDGVIIYMDAIVDSLRLFISNSGAKPNGLAVSVNSPDIITRNLVLPDMAAEEIPSAVRFEIIKYFPSVKDTHDIAQKVLSYRGPKGADKRTAKGADARHAKGADSDPETGAASPASGLSTGPATGLTSGPASEITSGPASGASSNSTYNAASGPAYNAASNTAYNAASGAAFGASAPAQGAGQGAGHGDGSAEPPDTAAISVLAALCPKELIRMYRELASRLGIPLRRVGIRADAQSKAIEYLAEEGGAGELGGAGIVIDIGYNDSLVSIVNDGKLTLSRYLQGGAAVFDHLAAESAGSTADDIRKARLSGDFTGVALDPGDAENIVSRCFFDIDEQIHQAADYLAGDLFMGKLSYVMVVGDGGAIPGAARHFERTHNLAGLNVAGAQAKTNKTVAPLLNGGNPGLLFAAFGAAIGVTAAGARKSGNRASVTGAHRNINFTPADISGKGVFQTTARLATVLSAAIFIAAAMIAFGVYFMLERGKTESEIRLINAEITQDIQAAEQSRAIELAQSRLDDINAVIGVIDGSSARASEIIGDLAAQAPDNLFIVNFTMTDAENVVMNGRSKDYDSVTEFASFLRRTEKYESVRINSVTVNQTASDSVTDYGFTMSVTIKQ